MLYSKINNPVSSSVFELDDLKNRLNVFDSVDDIELQALDVAGVQYFEDITNQTLYDTTYTLELDGFEEKTIPLVGFPIKSVTSITYIDDSGDTQTIPSTNYKLVDYSNGKAVVFDVDYVFPNDIDKDVNSVKITYIQGLFTQKSNVDEAIKIAVFMYIKGVYDQCLDKHMPVIKSLVKQYVRYYDV